MQGSGVDSSLNYIGKRQAEAFYNAYQYYPFDKIYTSDLQRSVQSVQRFIDAGVPHEKLTGLNEIHWGCKEGTPFSEDDHVYYRHVIKCWQDGDVEMCVEGGESPYQVQCRQVKALEYILAQQEEEQVLICMHGRAMRIFLCHMLNYNLRCMDFFTHDNLCLYKLSYTGSLFTLEAFNERDHVEQLLD